MTPSLQHFLRPIRSKWRSGTLRFPLALAALLSVVAAVLLVMMHRGHVWNGDFAQYLMHAQNIIEGKPYAETPYMRNPINNNPGPPAYPPGFPLLLAPIYAIFGTAILPMKMFIIATFVAGLGLMAYLVRDELPAPYALAVVVVLGFNPFLVHITSQVISDLPFLFFLLLSLVTWRRSRTQSSPKLKMVFAVLTGLFVYFTVLVRSLGVVLPASILIFELIDRRRLTCRALIVLGTVGLAFGLHTVVSMVSAGTTGSTGVSYYGDRVQRSLLDRFSELTESIIHSVYVYAKSFTRTVYGSATAFIGPNLTVLGVLTLLVVVGGWLHHSFSRPAAFDVFTPLYMGALLPWNFHTARYLIPVLPFFAFYAIYSLYCIRRRLGWKKPVLLSCVAGLFVFMYGWTLAHSPTAPNPTGALTPEAKRTYQYIRSHTPPSAVIMFGKPRFVALYTERRSVRWFVGRPESELIDYLKATGVDYVLVGPTAANYNGRVVKSVIKNHLSYFAPTLETRHYTLFRFAPGQNKRNPHD